MEEAGVRVQKATSMPGGELRYPRKRELCAQYKGWKEYLRSSSMNMCTEGEEKAEGSVVGKDLVCLIFKVLDFILWAVESMEGL